MDNTCHHDEDREILNHLPRCSQLRRKFLINDVCRLYNVTSSEVGSADYWRLLVNKHVSLIYCSIPKAGCTTLKSLVRYPEMSKDRVAIFRKSIIRNNLDKYQKLLLVRHPFSRLYSAYYDKILLSHLTYPQFYLDIAEKYFPGSTTGGTLNLTFEQFAKLVAYEYKTGAFVNRHWMTQYELCRPCQIRYDYVAKLETMDIDEPAIRAMTKVYGPIQKINSHANASDPKNLWAAYRNVGNDVIERLLQIYEADFRLFGYNCGSVYKSSHSARQGLIHSG
ncbi:hypothetical protein LSH36_493g04016 [Paralvinella palmiformis]|uniref:Carbohydrate sulfotransferase n=1 Tax=Paralvinella palmiformis TaxID=53620 RepID=A0AAD9J9M6_9ANNE|nr:hypothetical protein LSH36_493g04016 [Paralvinella palmiformis]